MYALINLFVVLSVVCAVSSNLVGGYHERKADDPECLTIATAGMANLNSNRVIKKIKRCATQVVAGTNAFVEAEICDKKGETFTNCAHCSMRVFRGLKPDIFEVNDYNCLPQFPTDKYIR